ncbi:uncharacterized protein PFL1_05444 [Pseudozyma flocculosa PF-1]|uniref:Related to PHO84 - high-affinity inorganic phosphate transporter n=2 Tax=Pseudozyma flocculosa TaxID=84751 RepID=A0A5C3F9X5_9BASI|nr:uncharacterized protein PFL1_05444 [Pseudozyma flocculosa PF-1]EPQ27163.1 hypothetical protein PFL1_05444 [Pseudozyma flocculosa PF-1]SPO41253.1 related to PHO84 - high-affinity inorganic phosphate transporter [Pseudozyma flocculosa]
MPPSHSPSQEALRSSFNQHASYQSHESTPRQSVADLAHPSSSSSAAAAARNSAYTHRSTATTTTTTTDSEDSDFDVADDHQPFLGSQRSDPSSSASRTGKAKAKSLSRPSSSSRPTSLNKRSSTTSIKMQRTASYKSQKDSTEGAAAANAEVDGDGPRTTVRRVGSRASVEGELTFDDIFDPSKTLAENKSLMISAEMDRMGMKRYAWCIWFLCGCGYFIDLLWAQALGLIATQISYEFYDETNGGKTGPLQTAFSTGLTVGAFVFGLAVDVVGRKWSFYLTTFISAIFGIAAGGANSFDTLCVLAAFLGFSIGGNIPIDATITLEFLPTNRRFLVAALSLFQPLGVLVCSGIAYGFIPKYSCESQEGCTKADNMGWRYTLYTLGCITWLIFVGRFFIFSFRESPQYLLARGEDEKALRIVSSIAKTNKAPPPLFTLDDFNEAARRLGVEQVDGEAVKAARKKETRMETAKRSAKDMFKLFTNAKTLFANKTMARVTIIIWITFIADFWGFTLAGFYLPQILRAKGAEQDTSISTTYRNYVLIYFPGIFAVAFGAAMIEVPRLGRQWAMVVSSALMAVSFFLFTIVNSQAASVGFNAMEYFFQSLFNSILYAFVPEIYPSQVRGTASGLASTLGRIAGIVAPLAADSFDASDPEQQAKNILYLAGGITLLCPVALALLPYDTRGARLH